MPNHVHLVVVPTAAAGLHRLLMAVHGQFAQRINRMRGLSGHLWQGRYFSSPLDENYFVNAVRYVELNPVRARLVAKAEDYAWSSAPAHCGVRFDPLLRSMRDYHSLRAIANWSEWLAEGTTSEVLGTLRIRAGRNLPCGSDEFVADLEQRSGRTLRIRKRGGQQKSGSG
jgi:putative transposase